MTLEKVQMASLRDSYADLALYYWRKIDVKKEIFTKREKIFKGYIEDFFSLI